MRESVLNISCILYCCR